MSKFKILSGSVIEGKKKAHCSIAKLTVGIGLSATLLTSGCATQNIQAYQNTTPTLDMHKFFSGQIEGWGMFQGHDGEVKNAFMSISMRLTKAMMSSFWTKNFRGQMGQNRSVYGD